MIRIATALCAAACCLSSAALAEVEHKPIEEKNLTRGRQTISADKGYVFLHAPERVNMLLLKEPSAEELAAFEAEWQTAFERAKRRYQRELEEWPEDVEFRRRAGRSPPPRPVEPMEESFSIGPLDLRMQVGIGPQYIFSKSEGGEFSYLMELEPGTYRYYGPVMVAPNGAAVGVCYCMGSVKFEVAVGRITNLGDFLAIAPDLEDWSQRAAVDYRLPATLADRPSEPADWRAAGKMNNFFGLRIDRMPAVPGVLAYQRDTVIDVKGLGQEGASGVR
jgi:hypothetical protein